MLRATIVTTLATFGLAFATPALAAKPQYGAAPSIYIQDTGVRVADYLGEAYIVSAVSGARSNGPDEVRQLDDQIRVRMAQFALENGRDAFVLQDIRSRTFDGQSYVEKGRRGTTQYACSGNNGGAPICSPAGTIGGTPDRRYSEPGIFYRTTEALMFTKEQLEAISSGRADPPSAIYSVPMNAETVYMEQMGTTVGTWPSLISVLEGTARRFTAKAERGDPEARIIAARTYDRLAYWQTYIGEDTKAREAAYRAEMLRTAR